MYSKVKKISASRRVSYWKWHVLNSCTFWQINSIYPYLIRGFKMVIDVHQVLSLSLSLWERESIFKCLKCIFLSKLNITNIFVVMKEYLNKRNCLLTLLRISNFAHGDIEPAMLEVLLSAVNNLGQFWLCVLFAIISKWSQPGNGNCRWKTIGMHGTDDMSERQMLPWKTLSQISIYSWEPF